MYIEESLLPEFMVGAIDPDIFIARRNRDA